MMAAVGSAFTVTVADAVLTQPAALVTVTVYRVDDAGFTVMAADVAPVLHIYVPPPLAVSVVDWPEQMERVPETDAAGSGFTVTVREAVAVHPAALVTVTV